MLAGRKLLLADDSITIQKVVELTFSDEGAEVVCVGNGRDAIEQLQEFQPDVVLADVFMPQVNGYELCEYIKQNEKLKHIPVMLLVGSFEPFDEAEARRVGANETLTKPFQSIRRLLEKVGVLAREGDSQDLVPTAELPSVEPEPEPEQMTDQEIALTTADTKPLTSDWDPLTANTIQTSGATKPQNTTATLEKPTTENQVMNPQSSVSEQPTGAEDELLDLGDFASASAGPPDEFVLDIDLNEEPEPLPVGSYPAYAGRPGVRAASSRLADESFHRAQPVMPVKRIEVTSAPERSPARSDQFAGTQEFQRPALDTAGDVAPVQTPAAPAAEGKITLEQLSPEVIDAIARRAVEQLSEKVVEEIAWEVVPQLAELLIKQQLEEKNS